MNVYTMGNLGAAISPQGSFYNTFYSSLKTVLFSRAGIGSVILHVCSHSKLSLLNVCPSLSIHSAISYSFSYPLYNSPLLPPIRTALSLLPSLSCAALPFPIFLCHALSFLSYPSEGRWY